MPNPFNQVEQIESFRGVKKDFVKNYQWYLQQVDKLRLSNMKPSKLLQSDVGNFVPYVEPGSMYLFTYSPLLKDDDTRLPMWDKYPLIFPFRITNDGFMGLNLHYLPYLMRARLLSDIINITTPNPLVGKSKARLGRAAWEYLNNISNSALVQPCVKRYLTKQLRSHFLKINPRDWKATIFLPIAGFQKMSEEEVWADSQKKIRQLKKKSSMYV